jgi:hypothetical protein
MFGKFFECFTRGKINFVHSIVDFKDICCYFLCVKDVVGIPRVLLPLEPNQWPDRSGKTVVLKGRIDTLSAFVLRVLIN